MSPIFKRKGSRFWQCQFHFNGKLIRRSCSTMHASSANECLQLWIAHFRRQYIRNAETQNPS